MNCYFLQKFISRVQEYAHNLFLVEFDKKFIQMATNVRFYHMVIETQSLYNQYCDVILLYIIKQMTSFPAI